MPISIYIQALCCRVDDLPYVTYDYYTKPLSPKIHFLQLVKHAFLTNILSNAINVTTDVSHLQDIWGSNHQADPEISISRMI